MTCPGCPNWLSPSSRIELRSSLYTYYSATVSKLSGGNDAYRDGLTGRYLETRYCFKFAYNDPAELEYFYGAPNRIRFSDGTICTLITDLPPNATLSRRSSDLYQDLYTSAYVQTRLCLVLALSDDALVTSSRVLFPRDVCDRA